MKLNKVVIRKVAAATLIVSLALFAAVGAAADDAPKKGFVIFGLSQLYDGTDQIQGGVGELLDGNRQLVDGLNTLGGALDEDIAGNLQTMKTGIDGEMLPGLSKILAGITGQVVPGLGDMKTGIDSKMVPGLGDILTGINGQVVPGLVDLRAGLTGKMSPGLSEMIAAFEGQIIPGLRQMQAGVDKEMIKGLDKMIGGINTDMVPALEGMKEGIDDQMVPGLLKILAGINGQIVPGLEGAKGGIDSIMVPTLDKMRSSVGNAATGLNTIIEGINSTTGERDLLDGLDELSGGISSQMLPLLGPAISNPLDPSTSYDPTTSSIRTDLEFLKLTHDIQPKEAYADLFNGEGLLPPGEDFLDNVIAPKVAGLHAGITHEASFEYPDPGVLQAIAMIRAGLSNPSGTPKPGVLEGLKYLEDEITKASLDPLNNPDDVGLQQAIDLIRFGLSKWIGPGENDYLSCFDWADQDTWGVSEVLLALLQGLEKEENIVDGEIIQESGVIEGLTKIRYGLSMSADPKHPLFDPANKDTFGVSEGLAAVLVGLERTEKKDSEGNVVQESGLLEGLNKIRGGLAGPVGGGLDEILAGLGGQIVPGLKEMKAGMDAQLVPGLNKLAGGLSGDITGGLTQIQGGLRDEVSPGLGDMLTGFNKTEEATGESGVIEGLTKISHGLANPEFTPNPGGDPGVSDGLGLVIGGIRTDVLGGIDELKGGITEKIIPGLEKMDTGISGELQPGFTKVSVLLLIIWLVSMVIVLVVGILVGRAGRARSSGQSASM